MKKLTIQKKPSSNKRDTDLINRGGLHNFFDRHFDDPFFRYPLRIGQLLNQDFFSGWWPKADISETEKEIKISLNLPGVESDNLNIEVDEYSLIVSGHAEKEKEEEGENWYRAEREKGDFKRVFELPNNSLLENIEADCKNGTLYIRIPKGKSSSKKKINIKVNK
jgi:HSP20 family protein